MNDIRRRAISYKKTAAVTPPQEGVGYSVNLNGQWQLSTTVPNPSTSTYDGVYESFSNKGVNNKAAIMYIDIWGYTEFTLYIRSYAESSYDYVMVSNLDKSIDNITSSSNTTLVKAHTSNKQNGGTSISDYTEVQFTGIDGGSHRITVVYRKDSSTHSNDDRGYVLISKTGYSGGPVDINNYLTIVALEDDLTVSSSLYACEYCIDGDGNWLSLAANSTTQSVNTGHTLSFRGNLTPTSSSGIGTFTISKNCNLEGNCMSMLFSYNAANRTSLDGKNYAFKKLFSNCTNIVSVSENFLPATTLVSECYSNMFSGCTGLTIAPKLPATTLANDCYYSMFSGCKSLTIAPELPATTLTKYCYSTMFSGCTSLTTAPELPVRTLANDCYSWMFNACTSLTTAPELPATKLKDSCYNCMFRGCTSLTTAPELPATTLTKSCYSSMFSGCTNLTTAPELHAITLAERCYVDMFSGCTSLTTAPALHATTLEVYCYQSMFRGCKSLTIAPTLPATTLANRCYSSMFLDCKSLTIAPELPATTLTIACYSYMFSGCNKLNYIKMLATDISATECLYDWVQYVKSTGTFVKDANMTSLPTGYSGIPSGWTVIDNVGN